MRRRTAARPAPWFVPAFGFVGTGLLVVGVLLWLLAARLLVWALRVGDREMAVRCAIALLVLTVVDVAVGSVVVRLVAPCLRRPMRRPARPPRQ